jgi:hypothetical protein
VAWSGVVWSGGETPQRVKWRCGVGVRPPQRYCVGLQSGFSWHLLYSLKPQGWFLL